MKRNIFLVVLLLILCSVSAFGQQKKFSAGVLVQVFSSEKPLADEFYNYLTGELRSLNDVTLQNNPDYSLIVFIEKLHDKPNGGSYAINYIFGKEAKCTYKQIALDGRPVQKNCTSLESINSTNLFATDDLKKKAQLIVAAFDTNILELDKQLFFVKKQQ